MNFITPVLKSISSPDISELEQFNPENGSVFMLLLEGVFAPPGVDGGDVFSFEVCSPEWIKLQAGKGFIVGRSMIVVDQFNFNKLKAFLQKLAAGCTGENWEEAAIKLSRYGHWEFEDYKP
jgi:Immunity protein 8